MSANHKGRDFITGDIHGSFELLEKILKKISFNTSVDRIFSTGDLVDRGPFSKNVLEWLKQPWFHSIRGNHEQMAIDSINGNGDALRHSKNGGDWFYKCSHHIQKEITLAFNQLPIAIEISLPNGSTTGIIHAEPPNWEEGLEWSKSIALLDEPIERERTEALFQALYARKRLNTMDKKPILGIGNLFVGHSTVPKPLRLGNTFYIDTGCSFPDGSLTIFDIKSMTSTSIQSENNC
ncbi:metallophosphoesterase [Pseudomonas putida]|nr:metallophosphoesterase [Pseudomonas putida]